MRYNKLLDFSTFVIGDGDLVLIHDAVGVDIRLQSEEALGVQEFIPINTYFPNRLFSLVTFKHLRTQKATFLLFSF